MEYLVADRAWQAGNVRFFAPLMVAKHARSVLKERGSITLTTGAVAEQPVPGWSLVAGYAAGLAGMVGFLPWRDPALEN